MRRRHLVALVAAVPSHVRRLLRESRSVGLLTLLVAFIAVPHSPAAAANWDADGYKFAYNSHFYYSAQDTRVSQSQEYFGWTGARGWMRWNADGYLAQVSEANHSNACVSMKILGQSPAGWVQGGIWRDRVNGRRTYAESMRDGYLYRSYGNALAVPSAHYAEVEFTGQYSGYLPIWRVRVANTYWYYTNRQASGKGTAQVELQQPLPATKDDPPSRMPTVFVGSINSGWSSVEHALYLRTGAGAWHLWNESLIAHTTWAHSYPAVSRYSFGYPYYYFGGWDNR